MKEYEADIAILGSGFAGSLMALVCERLGLRPIVVDKATHPRFAIGESSTPVADMILRDLSDLYDLPFLQPLSRYGTWKHSYPHLGVGRKRGFSYFRHEEGTPFTPTEDHGNELLVAASSDDDLSDTHWLRADVDAFLAAEVRGAGIPLLENTTVASIERRRAWHLNGRRGDDGMRIRADFVIDATGAGGALAQALGNSDASDRLRTQSRAIFAHLEGVPLWENVYGGSTSEHPFDCDAAAVHHVLDGAWIWVLRFDHGVVSTGIMLDARRYPRTDGRGGEEEWQSWMGRYPSLADLFADARPSEVPGGWIRTGRLQRRTSAPVGEGWAMLPHTAGFVDPLHSTGIAHSLSGVERLGRIIGSHWHEPTLTDALHSYGRDVLQELDFIDTLVAACYASMHDFRLFAASTMVYFAAVTAYEHARSTAGPTSGTLFLCAGEASLRQTAARALELLRNGIEPEEFETFVERGIRPFNRVGLFRPDVPNMYRHTTARV